MNRKRTFSLFTGAICTSVASVALSPGTAFASVNTSDLSQKAIVYNQHVVDKPYAFVHNHTTYIPIWYMMQALNEAGVQSTWQNHTWNLVVTKNPDLSNTKVGNGSSSIMVNGVLVQKVNELTAADPTSGKITTYMPAWYVMQVLNRLGIHSTWNGSVWDVYTGETPPAIGQLDIKLNSRPPSERTIQASLGQQIIDYAKKFIGTPYHYGGESTHGFDCSGFVQYVFSHFSVSLPRTSSEQAHTGSVISKSNLQPGDLVFFDTEGSPYSHVGIYVGDDKFISATTSHGVQVKSLDDPYYWGSRYTRSTNPGV